MTSPRKAVTAVWMVVGLTASPASAMGSEYVRDLDQRLSDEAETRLEELLAEHDRASGVRVMVETRGLAGAPDLWQGNVEQGAATANDSWLLLMVKPLELEWVAGAAVAGRLDEKVMRFIGEKHLAPRGVDRLERPDTLVEGVRSALDSIDTVLSGRTPLAYYAWKVLESSPGSPVNDGLQPFVLVGIRYLLGVLAMAPMVLLYLLAAWAVLPRVRLSFAQLMLLQLALVVPVTGLGVVLSTLGGGTDLGPLLRYGFMGAVFFLFATPLHLLAGLRVVGVDRPPAWLLALAYPLFPLAILAAGAIDPRTGQWAEIERQFRFIRHLE